MIYQLRSPEKTIAPRFVREWFVRLLRRLFRRTNPRTPLTLILALLIAVGFHARVSADDETPLTEPPQEQIDEALVQVTQMREALQQLEVLGDSWRPELAESLTSLARALQQINEHEQALAELERAVQISRINHGLFSLEQIPALHLQIDSHLAMEQWDDADGLRQYVFYVQSRALGQQSADLVPALIDYANWHLDAFAERRGLVPAVRLLDAYQLYAVAVALIDQHETPEIFPREAYLQQLAYISWLMQRTRVLSRTELTYSDERRIDDVWADGITGQRGRPSAFVRGQSALEEIITIRSAHMQDAAPESAVRADLLRQTAEAMLDLGDWHLLFDRRNAAYQAYREAYELLAREQPDQLASLFDRVVLIPAFEPRQGPDPRQQPSATPGQAFAPPSHLHELHERSQQEADAPDTDRAAQQYAYVTMSFDINRFGRPVNVNVVESVPADDQELRRRMVNALRDSRMRPRIREGQPVEATGLVYRFPFPIERQAAVTQ